jgi:D-serine deaminase-like pyridoxal phosphate-dependent protein
MDLDELATPALVVDADVLDANLALMAGRLPGRNLRPHVKAHKCTALAARQVEHGHDTFTCATPREMVGMATIGRDLLLANEVLDVERLRAVAEAGQRHGASMTVAVDSAETVRAAAAAGIGSVVVDVNVGLPRCGVAPEDAARIADTARAAGLDVRGVMGYEGHLQMVAEPAERAERVAAAMRLLRRAHDLVGGDLVSAGGTGTHDLHVLDLSDPAGVTEVQAGSYALMDSQYSTLGQGFSQALTVVGTVISVTPGADRRGWAVADVGLKALGMDHGDPTIEGASVWFCSDEHITFSCDPLPAVGDRVRVVPAHIDPTMARHRELWVVRGSTVVDRWAIDLRHW